jgi:hypothetical protein
MRENRNKITNIAASPRPIGTLCMPANIIKTINPRLPKGVSNKLTNKSGTANITSHNANNKLISPTNIFTFFSENVSFKEKLILYIIQIKYKICA